MDRASVEPIVIGIIEDRACVKVTRDLYDTDLTDLGVDSLTAIDIAHEVESALDAVIDDREVLRLRNVNEILDYVARAPATTVKG
jgi:acyl carrier protein